ncbi:NADH dehydrogenase, partial [Streptomyces sp. 150FB]
PPDGTAYETSGEHEEPESHGLLGRVPGTMLAVPAVLLVGGLLTGVVPGVGTAVARAVDEALPGTAKALPEWSATGVLLGLLSASLAAGLATYAVRRPLRPVEELRDWAGPLRRLHSGHVGDYVAWLLVGMVLLGALTLPGFLTV